MESKNIYEFQKFKSKVLASYTRFQVGTGCVCKSACTQICFFAFLPEAAWKSSKSELAAWVETSWGRKKKALDEGKGKERKVKSLSRV